MFGSEHERLRVIPAVVYLLFLFYVALLRNTVPEGKVNKSIDRQMLHFPAGHFLSFPLISRIVAFRNPHCAHGSIT